MATPVQDIDIVALDALIERLHEAQEFNLTLSAEDIQLLTSRLSFASHVKCIRPALLSRRYHASNTGSKRHNETSAENLKTAKAYGSVCVGVVINPAKSRPLNRYAIVIIQR